MKISYLPVTWETYETLTRKISAAILSREQPFDLIIAIGRGGLTFGHLLSDFLRIPISSITIQSYTDIQKQGKLHITAGLSTVITGKRVLLADDIADTGTTMLRAIDYLQTNNPAVVRTVTLFFKPHSQYRPDYFAQQTTKWILQPFESTEWITTFWQSLTREGKSKAEIQTFLHSLGYTDAQIKFVRRHFGA